MMKKRWAKSFLIFMAFFLQGAWVYAVGSDLRGIRPGASIPAKRPRSAVVSPSGAHLEGPPSRSFRRARVGRPGPSGTAEAVVLRTPAGRHTGHIVMSPGSRDLEGVIYLIFDEPSYAELFPRVDFHGVPLSLKDFEFETEGLRQAIERLRSSRELHSFHRYVGRVVKKKLRARVTYHRLVEHAASCNSKKASFEGRLCLGLQKNARIRKLNRMRVLIQNIHPCQSAAVEAKIIEWFGGQEDLGWNSQGGSHAPFECMEQTEASSLPAAESVPDEVMKSAESTIPADSGRASVARKLFEPLADDGSMD